MFKSRLFTVVLCVAAVSPAAFAHGVSTNVIGHEAGSCADVEFTFDDEKGTTAVEQRTFSGGSTLAIDAGSTPIQIAGDSSKEFTVQLCKGAALSAGAQALSAIRLEQKGDRLTVAGVQGDNARAYLLVSVPRGGSLDIVASNAPVKIRNVEGSVKAVTKNGPLHLSASRGTFDLRAVNGPVSVDRSSGKLELRTENGPIHVRLDGTSWNGEGLAASASNGPVDLSMPANYTSPVMVQSDDSAPVRFASELRQLFREESTDSHRTFVSGSGAAVVRVSTERGPVSVHQPKASD